MERSGSDAVRADRIMDRVVTLLFACASFGGPASMRLSEGAFASSATADPSRVLRWMSRCRRKFSPTSDVLFRLEGTASPISNTGGSFIRFRSVRKRAGRRNPRDGEVLRYHR